MTIKHQEEDKAYGWLQKLFLNSQDFKEKVLQISILKNI